MAGTRAGKKQVTREQIEAVLKASRERNIASPTGGLKPKQYLAKEAKIATNTRRVRKAQEKAANPTLTKKAQKAKDDRRLQEALTRKGEKGGRKGHDYNDLEDGQGKGKQAAVDALRADEQSKALGGERKQEESKLVKVLNFIGRPMFATAEAVNDNQEKYYRERHKGKGKLDSAFSGFKAGFGGWQEGISGKKKTTFSKVIQEVANNQKANRVGIGAARDNEIKAAKVNPVLKHGLGLTLDIFADPLTYTGIGTVAKVAGTGGKGLIKGADVVENLSKTAEVQKKLINSGAATKEQLDEVMAVARAPVEALKRKDIKALKTSNPDAYALAQQVIAARKTGPKFKRKNFGSETDYMGRKVNGLEFTLKQDASDASPFAGLKAGDKTGDVQVKVALEELGRVGSQRHYDELFKKEVASGKHGGWNDLDAFKKIGGAAYVAAKKENAATAAKASAEATKKLDAAGLTEKALREDLVAATLRNISPDVKKQLKLRVGTASVGVKGTEKVAEILAKARHGKVDKAVGTFNDTFRAMAKVAPSLNRLRSQELGRSSDRIRSQLIQQQKVWDQVDAADAKAAWKDWSSPFPNGSTIGAGVHPVKGKIDSAADFIESELMDIQGSINALKLTPNELGSWLQGINIPMKAGETYGWQVAKDGSQQFLGDPTWLVKHVKANAGKVDHPGKVLFALHAAVEHATAKRAVYESAAQHFGVPVRKTSELTGHTGSTLANRLASEVVTKNGYVKVDLPGTENMVFHPDIAEGMKKLDTILNDRVTMDKWLKTLDDANQLFKGLVTRYNPSFHVRTMASELMLSYIGGMRNPGWAYNSAFKVLRGRNREILAPDSVDPTALAAYAGDRSAVGAINTATDMTGANAAAAAGTGAKTVFRHPRFGRLTADQIWGIYKNTGLKTGFATTDVARSTNVSQRGAAAKVNEKLQDRFEDVEDFGRLAHFMDVLKHSKAKTLDEAVNEASETVLKYHLDYTAVTQFEKTWATRAMPFYKWVRLSTPMILESLAHNPGKAMVAPKTLASLSEMAGYDMSGFGIAPGGADALVPEFLRETGSVPLFNSFGDNQFFNPAQTVPLYGMLNESNNNPVSKVTPFVRAPIEFGLNASSMGKPPRADRGEGNFDAENIGRFAAQQAPQLGLAARMTGFAPSDVDKRQQLLAFLANPGFQPNTPARMNAEAQQQRDKAIAHRAALKRKLGIE